MLHREYIDVKQGVEAGPTLLSGIIAVALSLVFLLCPVVDSEYIHIDRFPSGFDMGCGRLNCQG